MGSFVFKAGNSSSEQGGRQAGGENYGVLVSMINQDFFIIPSLGSFEIANVTTFLCGAHRSRRYALTRQEQKGLVREAKYQSFLLLRKVKGLADCSRRGLIDEECASLAKETSSSSSSAFYICSCGRNFLNCRREKATDGQTGDMT